MSQLPVTPVGLNLLELGYLNAFVWGKVARDPRDPTARGLFTKFKDAAIALGVEWRYGELPELPKDDET